MASRNHGMWIDYGVFSDLAEQFDKIGGDLETFFAEAMEDMGEDVGVQTKEAVAKAYLPAHGIFSTGDTEKAIVMNPKAEKSGASVEIGLGFDKSIPGAGGFLITGTPRMAPDHKLEEIFVRKQYRNKWVKEIHEKLSQEIAEKLRGFS